MEHGAGVVDDYPVRSELDAPLEVARWRPLFAWVLAIPHLLVASVLANVAGVIVVIAWFAILFTGRYPRGLFDFVVGVTRWWLRVQAYAVLLVTDRYPPFSLKA